MSNDKTFNNMIYGKGGLRQDIHTIGHNTSWNMRLGNLWTTTGTLIANPSNVTAGQCGLIFCQNGIVGWGSYYKHWRC